MPTEKETIQMVLQGNRKAYADLVNQYKDLVYNICIKVLQNSMDAEEAAQDTFVKAFKSLGSFKFDAKFSTWLYRIAYNTAISKQRSTKRAVFGNQQTINEETTFSTDTENQADHRTEGLQQALFKLSSEAQSLISLHYTSEKSVDEISKITGLSKSNVKIKLFRARNKLKELMQTNKVAISVFLLFSEML